MIERRPTRLLVAGGSFMLVAFHLWASARVPDPTVVFDESGYLGNARWLAGGAVWEMPFSPSYSAGYSLLLAPVMAVTSDPDAQWIGVRTVNALLLACVFPLLFGVLSRFRSIPPRRALAGAFVGSLVPAVVAASPSGIAENLVLPLVPATVLTMWWMFDESRPLGHRLLLGPTMALLYAAHPRFTLAVGVVAGLLAWAAIRHRVRPAVAIANGAGLATGVAAATALDRIVVAGRWAEVEHLEGDAGAWVELATSGTGVRELALSATGQLWYLAVGSFGLGVIGIAWLALHARSSPTTGDDADQSAVLRATLAIAGSVLLTSVVFFAQNQFRPDHLVYGRHNDSFSTLWIGVGVTCLLDRSRLRRATKLLALSGTAIATLGAVVVLARDATVHDAGFSPFAVPALTRLLGDDLGSAFARATLLGLVGWAAIAIVVAASAPKVLAIGLVGGFVHLGTGPVVGTADFHRLIYESWDPVPVLERIGVDELCVDGNAGRGMVNLLYGWALPEVTIRSYRSDAGEEPTCRFTIAALDDAARPDAGDRIVLVDEGGSYPSRDLPLGVALWVAPGPDADRLDALGALLPTGFPASLPVEARKVTLATDSRVDEPILIPASGRFGLTVSVTHAGRGSPWPDTDSFGLDGRVEVLARIRPLDHSRPAVTILAGSLPTWMWPGDTTIVPASVFAVDDSLAPLRAGDYEVTLGIGQIGDDWFSTGEAPIELRISVTG